jgi:hypothetical protein
MVWVRKGCTACKVELDEGSAIEVYPTKCCKCNKDLELL